ncbi:hypothetical protein DMUE_1991 [Dictyocoela muelleri]|nr:hypothetical protein DMUE_1991 [Dictyocoela muelleri]
MYWILFTIEPKYVWGIKLIESGYLPYLPADICAHGLPYFILIINSFDVVQKRCNIPLILIISFYVGYITMISILFLVTNRWPYPFLKFIDPLVRVMVFLAGLVVCCLHYELMCMCFKRIKKK